MNLFDLTGKLALVTGARRGIGLAIADALAAAGADLIGVSAALETTGSEVGKRVRDRGRRFYSYRADFAERAAVMRFLNDMESDGHEPDILVNNAGTIRRVPAVRHGDDDWDEVIAVNLSSQFVLSRELGRRFVERGGGKIIFVASLLSFQGGITVPGYTAAKSGIVGLTRALANEWAPHGVNVNAIVPGYIATDNTAALRADASRNQAILQRIPAGRWGEPTDLAGAAIFLASSASDYVNGSTVTVDGGWLGR
jgi:2-dehydro-3-deoxy-D-gluconate 5-dehydrogenase